MIYTSYRNSDYNIINFSMASLPEITDYTSVELPNIHEIPSDFIMVTKNKILYSNYKYDVPTQTIIKIDLPTNTDELSPRVLNLEGATIILQKRNLVVLNFVPSLYHKKFCITGNTNDLYKVLSTKSIDFENLNIDFPIPANILVKFKLIVNNPKNITSYVRVYDIENSVTLHTFTIDKTSGKQKFIQDITSAFSVEDSNYELQVKIPSGGYLSIHEASIIIKG